MRPRDVVGIQLALGMFVLTGCSDPSVCTENIERAIEVEVREAASDRFIADIARGVVHESGFTDSLRIVGWIGADPALPTTLGAADERTGTYAVHLEAEGHVAWDTADVRATSDGCHVITQRFTARLEPAF